MYLYRNYRKSQYQKRNLHVQHTTQLIPTKLGSRNTIEPKRKMQRYKKNKTRPNSPIRVSNRGPARTSQKKKVIELFLQCFLPPSHPTFSFRETEEKQTTTTIINQYTRDSGRTRILDTGILVRLDSKHTHTHNLRLHNPKPKNRQIRDNHHYTKTTSP